MKYIYILWLFILATVVFGCQKDKPYKEELEQATDEVHPELKDGELIPGQYIIFYTNEFSSQVSAKFKSELKYEEIALEVEKETSGILTTEGINRDNLVNTFGPAVMGFTIKLNEEGLNKLRKNKYISYIEQDRIIALGQSSKKSLQANISEGQVEPWGVRRVGRGDGSGKVAWILDSGIDPNHPDLTVDKQLSISFLNGKRSRNYSDQYGHGTHVAGIIAGKDNELGIVGVASGSTIVAVKVLDKFGRGTFSDVVNAVNYVSSNAKPGDVVNISFNGDTSFALDYVIANTASRGIFFSLSSGNDGDDSKYYSPGRIQSENVYTISAMDSTDTWYLYSNFGNPPVDYCAPGVEVLSTYKNGTYALMDGTSMAAPHVAGILLLNNGIINTDGLVKNDIDGNPDPIAHK